MVEFTYEQLKLMLAQRTAKLQMAGRQLAAMQKQNTTLANTIKFLTDPLFVFLGEHGQVKHGEKLPLGSALLVVLRTCVHNAGREVPESTSEGILPPDSKVIAP